MISCIHVNECDVITHLCLHVNSGCVAKKKLHIEITITIDSHIIESDDENI